MVKWTKALLPAAAMLVLAAGPGSASGAPQPSANGNGDIQLFQSFSFSTRGALFGAEGHVSVTFPSTDPNTQYRGRVNCALYVGNRVTLSGNITSAPVNPFFQETDFVAFGEDNGEPGALRDRWGFQTFTRDPFSPPPPTCLAPLFFGGSIITSGNVDVDP
jgi:hypothetical protein